MSDAEKAVKQWMTPFKVGLFVLVATGVLIAFWNFIGQGRFGKDETLLVHAYFQDASGLASQTRVQAAGIAIGEVVDVRLENGRALVLLRLAKKAQSRKDAVLRKRSESILGDFVLDILPGSPQAPLLEDGDEILRVLDAEGIEQIFSSLTKITDDISQVTAALRESLSGAQGTSSLTEIVDNMVKISRSLERMMEDTSGKLEHILSNVDVVSQSLSRIALSEESDIKQIVKNIEGVTRDMRSVMATLNALLSPTQGQESEGVLGVKNSIQKLENSLANIEELTRKVKEGEGTVGKLLADERLGQRLSETLEDIADFTQRLTSLNLEVDVRSEYLFRQGQAKNTFGLRLIPRPDKYYRIELIDDPRGSTSVSYIQQNPPNAGSPAVQKQTVTTDKLKISAEFAKRYSLLTLRFGIIESSGGIGIDLGVPIKFPYSSKWIENALLLRVDAFHFSAENLDYPRLRASLRFSPLEHVYLQVGMDDILNRPNRDLTTNKYLGGRDFFVGGGIYFTDEDLKSLFTLVPTP
ncbi:MAG: MlaD family protein [Cystobacterineae bacterium]|nr:MlaD family protein [Cystobacterineae bacterium]